MKGRQWAFLLSIRTLAVIYCLQVSGAMMMARNDSIFKGGLHIQHETWALGVFGFLGLTHLYGMLQLCWRQGPVKTTKVTTTENAIKMQLQRRWRQLNDSGTLLVLAELVELPLQTLQCELIHAHTVSQMFAWMFTSILILNCWVIAHPKASLHLCLLVDIVLDMAYVLLPLTCLGLPLLIQYINDKSTLSTNFEWFSWSTNVGSSLAITSAVDLCSKASPLFWCHIRLWTLGKRWQRKTSNLKKTLDKHPKFKWFRGIALVWGWVILGLTLRPISGLAVI